MNASKQSYTKDAAAAGLLVLVVTLVVLERKAHDWLPAIKAWPVQQGERLLALVTQPA